MLTFIEHRDGLTASAGQVAILCVIATKTPSEPASGVVLSTLVILGASITGLAVARDAHRHGLQAIVVDSEDGPALHSRRATPVSVGAVTEKATIDRILSLGGPQAALISTSDQWIRFVIEHRSLLSSAYKTILHPDNAALELCLDKMAFSDWCITSGLPCPAVWTPGSGPRPASLKFSGLAAAGADTAR